MTALLLTCYILLGIAGLVLLFVPGLRSSVEVQLMKFTDRPSSALRSQSWGRSAAALVWYGLGLVLASAVVIGTFLRLGIFVIVLWLLLMVVFVIAAGFGGAATLQSRRLFRPRVWEIFGWIVIFGLVMLGWVGAAHAGG